MKRVKIILIIFALSLLAGCSLEDKVTVETATQGEEIIENTEQKKPTIIRKEKEAVEEIKVYGIGERVVVRDEYAVTLIGVTEVSSKDSYYVEGRQALLIELMFENLSIDLDHPMYKLESRQSNGYDFWISDGSLMVPDTKITYNWQETHHTPVESKSLQRYVYVKETPEDSVEIRFDDYLGENTHFEVNVGDKVNADLEGKQPKRSDASRIGEPLLLAKAENDYTVTIDSVRKLDRSELTVEHDAGAVYEIMVTHSNYTLENFGKRGSYELVIVDEKGNTGYKLVIEGYPRELEGGGVQTISYYTTHIDSDELLLFYYDRFRPDYRSHFIQVDHID